MNEALRNGRRAGCETRCSRCVSLSTDPSVSEVVVYGTAVPVTTAEPVRVLSEQAPTSRSDTRLVQPQPGGGGRRSAVEALLGDLEAALQQ
jgi:hypothetical protein